ncbi:hypothetical protein [Halopseudomonas pelagia]|uniref:hypothetical protein n=1 Tax=Halopseudomonas pelagia TaxID=553151 RepID=UPI0003B43624|nr:hypothetical protein [Halopseudomonas pelagia]
MKKEKATPKSSPKTSHGKFNPHLDQLKVAIYQDMQHRGNAILFATLQDIFRNQGYTRQEVITHINELVADGLLEYQNREMPGNTARSASVRVLVKLAGGKI